jgi:hypothetical protein
MKKGQAARVNSAAYAAPLEVVDAVSRVLLTTLIDQLNGLLKYLLRYVSLGWRRIRTHE